MANPLAVSFAQKVRANAAPVTAAAQLINGFNFQRWLTVTRKAPITNIRINGQNFLMEITPVHFTKRNDEYVDRGGRDSVPRFVWAAATEFVHAGFGARLVRSRRERKDEARCWSRRATGDAQRAAADYRRYGNRQRSFAYACHQASPPAKPYSALNCASPIPKMR